MKIVTRNVYLSEFEHMTYLQRLFFVWANDINPFDLQTRFKPNLNPLKWCVLDILKVIWLLIVYVLILPLIMLPYSLYYAKCLKTRYKDYKPVIDGNAVSDTYRPKVLILE